MELVVSIGIISMISSIVLSSVIGANTNSTTANIISHMDNITTQAKEVFQLYPDDVLNGSTREDPYVTMSNIGLAKDTNGNEIAGSTEYITHYNEGLSILRIDDPAVQYKLVVTFLPKTVDNVKGFSHSTVKYEMEANVYAKETAPSTNFKKESLYTKVFEFDRITTNAFESIPKRTLTVSFDPNGGTIYLNGAKQSSGKYEQKYYTGEAIYGGGRFITSKKDKNKFIGWSTSNTLPNSRILINPDTYKVKNSETLYAQYLKNDTTVEYRLQLNLGPDESWNVSNSSISNDSIFFEKEVSASNPAPLVKNMGNDVDEFFKSNAVKKRGYKFLHWRDSNGKEVDTNTQLKEQYMQLYPVFKKLDNDRTELISVNLTLDLTNEVAGTSSVDSSKSRLYAVYPFTKMEYEIKYVKDSDSFDVIQVEKIDNAGNKYGSLPGGLKDGDVLSTKTYNTNVNTNVYVDDGTNKHKTLGSYIASKKTDPNDPFIIDAIDLRVNAPKFDISSFYSNADRDNLSFGSGSVLDSEQTRKLFVQTEDKKPTFTYKSSKPIQQTKNIQDLKERIAILSKLPVMDDMFDNSGRVFYQSSGDASFTTRNVSHTTTQEVGENRNVYLRGYTANYTLPFNSVYTDQNFNAYFMNLTPDVMKAEDGEYYLTLRIKDQGITWRSPSSKGSMFNSGDSDNDAIIQTGIPLYGGNHKADKAHEDPEDSGNYYDYEVYNYIHSVNVMTLNGGTRRMEVTFSGLENTADYALYKNQFLPLVSKKGAHIFSTSVQAPVVEGSFGSLNENPKGGWVRNNLLDTYQHSLSEYCAGTCSPVARVPFKKKVLELPVLVDAEFNTKANVDDLKVGSLRKTTETVTIDKKIATFENTNNTNFLPPFIGSIPYTFK